MQSKAFFRYCSVFAVFMGVLFNTITVSAEPGNIQWTLQDLPSSTGGVMLNGSSIAGIAVGSDGKTIYVADNGVPPANGIYKSNDAGQSFDKINNNYTGGTPTAIAVAPDDVKTAAVTNGASVWITTNGGTTWSALPNPLTGAYVGATITDIAVAPARPVTLLGREFAVSIADPATGAAGTARGDILIIGGSTAWNTAGATAPGADRITGAFDFTAVVFTPNFTGDRGIVAVGTKNAAGSTAVVIINTATGGVVNNPTGALVATGTILNPPPPSGTGTTTEFGVVASGILSSSIALPTNFDPTTISGRRGYVGIAATATFTDNDVYRFDNNSVRALGAASAAPIKSVSYHGTTGSGILFAGFSLRSDVKYTTDMTSNSPNWTTSLKGPTGTSQVVVMVASDYAATSRVFAGTTGARSAFSVSTNGGASFDGESLINNGAASNVGAIDGIEVSPDGAWLFLASHAGGSLFLYKSATPVTSTSWSLVLVRPGTLGLLKLNKDWGNTPAVYLADMTAGGNISVSQNGGATFSARTAPAGIVPAAMAIPNANTVYLAGGATIATAKYVYLSTNGAFFWDSQSDSQITGVVSIAVPVSGTLIVGGSGAVSYSTNGGSTFTRIDAGLAPAPAAYQVTADIDYGSNYTIFAGSSIAVSPGTIYRYIIGTSSTWENTRSGVGTPGVVVGMAGQKGAVYAMGTDSAGRTVNPLVGSDNVPSWEKMDVGGLAGAKWFTTVGLPTTNILYTANDIAAGPLLWAFNDWLALTKPVLVSPPDKFTVPVNPATGFAEDVTLSWQPAGSGTGLVNTVNVEIYRKTPQFDTGKVVNGIVVNPENPYVTIVANALTAGNVIGYNMLPGWEYVWYIRFSNTVSNEGITTYWVDSRTIIVQAGGMVSQPYAGPMLTGPAPGATGLDPKTVGFTWAPVSGATEYQLIIATDAALTETVAGTPANVSITAYQASGLEYGKTYFWTVKPTKPVASIQSIGTFTTMQKPAPQPAPTPADKTTPNPATPATSVNSTPSETPVLIWGIFAIGALLLIILIIRFAVFHGGR